MEEMGRGTAWEDHVFCSAAGCAVSGFLKPSSGELSLDRGVHVWRFPLGSRAEAALSPAEVLRAAKCGSADARSGFLAGRSGVRLAGSLYSGIPPGDLAWSADANGKPYFANAGIHFNISHTGGTVVAAFSGSPVGIDIEPRGRCRDFSGIANRFFHPDEAAALRDEEDFLRLWTRKEAMLKLSGEGLSGGLADARPGAEGVGTLRGKRVFLAGFTFGNIVGALASFEPFEVKGWFQI